MTALSPSRRRAERFAAAVDGTGPVTDLRLEPLLAVSAALRSAADVPEARPAYVADLRARLMAEADTALVPATAVEARLELPHRHHAHRAPANGRHPVRVTAAAAALAIVAGTTGAAVAAESSLPGQPLYLLKRGIEQSTSVLHFSDASRGKADLAHAAARLDEVDGLLADGRSDRAISTLGTFRSQAQQGADLLFTSYQDDANPADVVAVRSFANDAMSRLAHLRSGAPASTGPAFVRTASVLTALDAEARLLCPGCGSQQELSAPGLLAAPSAQQWSGAPGAVTRARPVQAQTVAAAPANAQPSPSVQVSPPSAAPPPSSSAGSSSSSAAPTSTVKQTIQKPASTSGLSGAVQGLTGPVTSTAPGLGAVTGTVTDGVTDTVDGVVGGLTGDASPILP